VGGHLLAPAKRISYSYAAFADVDFADVDGGSDPSPWPFFCGREELGSNGCLFSEQHAALFPLRHRAIDREDAAADFAFMILGCGWADGKSTWCAKMNDGLGEAALILEASKAARNAAKPTTAPLLVR
jgi:hypothetical protein